MEELFIIYKIYSKDNKYIYVGSTKNLKERINKHKSSYHNTNDIDKYNLKVYKTIRENGGWNEFIIEKIEEMYCNKKDAFIRETELMKILNSNLNSINAYASKEEVKKQKQEYRLKNKEKLKEQKKEYNMKNKEKINEKNREYRMNKRLEKFKNEEKEKTINNITNNYNITNLTINN